MLSCEQLGSEFALKKVRWRSVLPRHHSRYLFTGDSMIKKNFKSHIWLSMHRANSILLQTFKRTVDIRWWFLDHWLIFQFAFTDPEKPTIITRYNRFLSVNQDFHFRVQLEVEHSFVVVNEADVVFKNCFKTIDFSIWRINRNFNSFRSVSSKYSP